MSIALSAVSLSWYAPAQPADIPDAVTLLREVQPHQREMDDIRENYTFHRMRRVEEVDRSGVVKSTTTLEREVFFVNGHQIAKTVRKNGADLSAREARDEQARVAKLIETAMKSPPNR